MINWWAAFQRKLVPIEKMQNEFVVSSYMEERKRKNNSIFWSSVIGGIAGGITASVISGGTVMYIPTSSNMNATLLLTNIPALKKEQPEASKIDFDTGELYF